jgi:epoxyqueuosine reductase
VAKELESAVERAARVKAHARAVGFDLVGVTGTAVPEAFARFSEAVDKGYGAGLPWLVDEPELRRDVRNVWPAARSVVVLGVSYASEVPGYLEAPPGADEGWIARYAQGRDYHEVVRRMLVQLVRKLGDDAALGAIPSVEHRIFVDTGPVLEKAFAQAAGLGWIGKNTLLIHPGGPGGGGEPYGPVPPAALRKPGEEHGRGAARGSWYFLAVVLTPLDLAADTPETDHCGTCRRCLDVCPTQAFPAPYVLDARRCIATWTIEAPDPDAMVVPEQLGQHVFGCDLCQEVCPWNRRPSRSRHVALRPRPDNVRPALDDLASLDDDAFRARFHRSAVLRVTREHMGKVIKAIRRA